ncbi:MAG: transcription antitermination factor NusB [Dehalococcoidia bacterium]
MAGPRRQARIKALQALYEADSVGHDLEEILRRVEREGALAEKPLEFASELARGVMRHRKSIDQTIQTYAPNWPVEQLSIIDRNILRIAIFELTCHKKTPPKAVANEAVELAKSFGSDSSTKFVNGVIGTLMAEMSR